MGNILSVNATAAERQPDRDAAGGSATETTGGATDVSKTTQVTGKSGGTATGGVAATGATAAGAATSVTQVVGTGVTQPTVQQRPETDDEEEYEEQILDQCGLDPDPEGLWVDDEPEPRIKESRLTPEERAKFRGLLDRIFHPDTVKGIRLDIKPNEVLEVADTVIPYLESEPVLIEDVPFDITIVGDLHGQLHDLYRVFKSDEKDGKPGWENMKYLFLGDYVDRGRQSLEVVLALFCIKMLYPDRIFLLRGNHEFTRVNARYGFIVDFMDRFDEKTCDMLFFKINEVFCWLSIAAIVGNKYLCTHGGISTYAFTRRCLNAIRKPILESRRDVRVHDIIWSDYASGLRGTAFNPNRKTSFYYGLDELALALYNMDCTTLFRGHSMVQSGFAIHDNLCVSLFTATGVTKDLNNGAVAVLDAHGKVTFRVFECNPARREWIRKLRAWDAGREVVDDDDDDVTVSEDSDDEGGFGRPMARV